MFSMWLLKWACKRESSCVDAFDSYIFSLSTPQCFTAPLISINKRSSESFITLFFHYKEKTLRSVIISSLFLLINILWKASTGSTMTGGWDSFSDFKFNRNYKSGFHFLWENFSWNSWYFAGQEFGLQNLFYLMPLSVMLNWPAWF